VKIWAKNIDYLVKLVWQKEQVPSSKGQKRTFQILAVL
jgi:hypothetical protein